jgi:hypothetical protein
MYSKWRKSTDITTPVRKVGGVDCNANRAETLAKKKNA